VIDSAFCLRHSTFRSAHFSFYLLPFAFTPVAVTVDRPSPAGAGEGGWKPGEGRRAKLINPLEIVFFMRSVASKNFFEQMKGRGVRVVSDTEMEQVNPGVKRKTRYLTVDAVGVAVGNFGHAGEVRTTVNQLQSLLCAASKL
jgi:hypothetical protein